MVLGLLPKITWIIPIDLIENILMIMHKDNLNQLSLASFLKNSSKNTSQARLNCSYPLCGNDFNNSNAAKHNFNQLYLSVPFKE